MKKLICVLLSVLIALSVLSMSVSAETARTVLDSGLCGADGDNVLWTLYKDGELVISGEGEMADFGVYNIPWEEAYGKSIRKVTVENGVTSVGDNAFRGLYYAAEFNIADSVVSVGEYSFGWTSFGGFHIDNFSEIKIPVNVTDIDKKAFYRANIDRIVIPEKITAIKEGTFTDCFDLDTVVIPASVTLIEENAFGGCDEIDTVYFRGTREQWNSISFGQGNGYLKNADNIFFDAVCHNYEPVVIAPTCKEKGCTNYVCEICGDEYVDENSYTDTISHTTTNGKCDMCERIIAEVGEAVSLSATVEEKTEIEWKLAEDNAVITDVKSTTIVMGSFFRLTSTATVKGAAVGENVVTATVNGKEISTVELVVLPHTHKYSVVSVTDATCTEKGFTTYACPCGDSYNDNYTDVTEHSYLPIVKEPTCFENGYTEYLCVCGESYIDDYVDMLEHECGWITVTEPQAGIDGAEIYQCALCETIFEQRSIPALCALGDVNRDGKINAMDARLTLRVASKLDTFDDDFLSLADVTGDGRITALDARAILRHSAKIEFIK